MMRIVRDLASAAPFLARRFALPALAGLLAMWTLAIPGPAAAQAWRSWAAAPDSALGAELRATGGRYEAEWNALLVTELRLRLARSDSAQVLLDLAIRVSRAEPAALGSRIAPDAIRRRLLWPVRGQWRDRVRAAVAESLGVAAQGARDWHRADSLFMASLGDYRALGEKRRMAWVLGSLGLAAFQSGRMARADTLYREALVARRAVGDPRMIGNTLNSLGVTFYLLHRYPEAFDYLQQARVTRELTGERAALGATLNYLALTSAALGRTDSTEIWYRRSLVLTVGAGDSARTVETLVNFSGFLVDRGRFDEALALQERAMTAASERGDATNLGRLLFQTGSARAALGRFGEAIDCLNRAIETSAEAADAVALPGEWLELSRVLLVVGDADHAMPAALRARAVADSLDDASASSGARTNLAMVAEDRGDRDEAARQALEGLRLAEAAGDSERVGDAGTVLGDLALARGDVAAYRHSMERALAANANAPPQRVATYLVNLGNAAAMENRFDEAEKWFARADSLARAAGLPEYQWRVPLGRGDVAERRGDFARALALDRQAATLIDTLRTRQGGESGRIALFDNRLFAYEALIHLLGKLDAAHPDSGFAAEAFTWAERARARALLDAVAGGAGERAVPRTLAQAQAALDDRTALLEYSLGDSSSSLWVVTKKHWTRLTLPPRAQLRTRVEVLRRSLGDPRRAESKNARAAARALYRALVEPAEGRLGKSERLIVSPDGPLALIPFEALLAKDVAEGAVPPKKAWLGERYTISYTSSATALALLGGRRSGGQGGDIVAVGDPRFGAAARLAALPNTAAEVEALRRIGGDRVTALTGVAATRERLLALPSLGTARVIHVATHGEANESEPSRSGLWLAAPTDSAAPGFLSVGDIAGLKLSADLVTLSACETGVGRLERGEGVIGLTRAFLASGARGVVVSLWPVNDRSTARLMETFYESLLKKKRGAAESLADARRKLLGEAETRSPFYWAPFVLVGGAEGR